MQLLPASFGVAAAFSFSTPSADGALTIGTAISHFVLQGALHRALLSLSDSGAPQQCSASVCRRQAGGGAKDAQMQAKGQRICDSKGSSAFY